MMVYVLLKIDDYDRAEVLGVFVSNEKAKEYAQKQEPDRPFPWRDNGDASYVPTGLYTGPMYTYDITAYEIWG